MYTLGKVDARSGFQKSETTSAIVTIYKHGDDPVLLTEESPTEFLGKKSDDSVPSIVSVQTNKAMGSSSGNFVINVKPSKSAESLFETLVDDDWIDISFGKHGESWHTLRGLIDEVRITKSVGGTGATAEVFTITGRDFGKIWEGTPVWFNPYASHDFVSEAKITKIFKGLLEIANDPGTTAFIFLKDFLEAIADDKGSNWNPPKGMPSITNESLRDSLEYSVEYFQNVPERINFNLGGAVPQGMLWDLAKQYSDPMFTELYVDVLPEGDPFSAVLEAGDPVSPKDTKMTVVMRDKPFPIVYTGLPTYVASWDSLPTFEVQRQEIYTTDLGRSGFERFNTYFMTGLLTQENLPTNAITQLAPLYDGLDIKRHGMRRMDFQTNVVPDPAFSLDHATMYEQMRYLLRDWYCMNPYLLSGTIELAHGRPDIKIGCRVRIPGAALANNREQPTETYYVETVDHVWQFGSGMRTILGVTRGWLGTDAEYLAALTKVTARYTVANIITGMI